MEEEILNNYSTPNNMYPRLMVPNKNYIKMHFQSRIWCVQTYCPKVGSPIETFQIN